MPDAGEATQQLSQIFSLHVSQEASKRHGKNQSFFQFLSGMVEAERCAQCNHTSKDSIPDLKQAAITFDNRIPRVMEVLNQPCPWIFGLHMCALFKVKGSLQTLGFIYAAMLYSARRPGFCFVSFT